MRFRTLTLSTIRCLSSLLRTEEHPLVRVVDGAAEYPGIPPGLSASQDQQVAIVALGSRVARGTVKESIA